MKQRLLIALLTAFGFAAGFAARMLTEAGPTVPPPPAPGTEFVRSSTATPAADAKQRGGRTFSDKERAKIVSQIQEVRPKIDLYRKRIEEIADDFDRQLVTVLTPEQREKFEAKQKRDAERRAKGERQMAETVTLSDEQIYDLQQRPLWYALWNVAINGRLERLNRDLKLDDQQQARVRALLLNRREQFLELVDSIPPPSITLSLLATQSDKISSAAKK